MNYIIKATNKCIWCLSLWSSFFSCWTNLEGRGGLDNNLFQKNKFYPGHSNVLILYTKIVFDSERSEKCNSFAVVIIFLFCFRHFFDKKIWLCRYIPIFFDGKCYMGGFLYLKFIGWIKRKYCRAIKNHWKWKNVYLLQNCKIELTIKIVWCRLKTWNLKLATILKMGLCILETF